jgi:N-methylhydantoinase B/oxoprolinase/acetone carboxylase alpha subunit
MALQSGSRLGHYELFGLLGSGGMGEVYVAQDTKLGRQVALKVLRPEALESPERRKRFEREAKRFVYIDIQGGGAGARPTKDGRDGQDSHLARFRNTPVEAAELEYPVRIERYELIPDTGGAKAPGRPRPAA